MFINYLRLLPASLEVTRINARCDVTYFMHALSRHSTLARKYLGHRYEVLKHKLYGKKRLLSPKMVVAQLVNKSPAWKTIRSLLYPTEPCLHSYRVYNRIITWMH
jgi:hypothetical protein